MRSAANAAIQARACASFESTSVPSTSKITACLRIVFTPLQQCARRGPSAGCRARPLLETRRTLPGMTLLTHVAFASAALLLTAQTVPAPQHDHAAAVEKLGTVSF